MKELIPVALLLTLTVMGCITAPEKVSVDKNLTETNLLPSEIIVCEKTTYYKGDLISEETAVAGSGFVYMNSSSMFGEGIEVLIISENNSSEVFIKNKNNTCWDRVEMNETGSNTYYIGNMSVRKGEFLTLIECEKKPLEREIERPKPICEGGKDEAG